MPPVVALVVPGVSECILSFEGDVNESVRHAQAADVTGGLLKSTWTAGYEGRANRAD